MMRKQVKQPTLINLNNLSYNILTVKFPSTGLLIF